MNTHSCMISLKKKKREREREREKEREKEKKRVWRYKVEGSLIDGGPEDPTKRKKEKESRKQLYREYGGELDDWTEVKLHSSFIEFSLFKRYIYAPTDSGNYNAHRAYVNHQFSSIFLWKIKKTVKKVNHFLIKYFLKWENFLKWFTNVNPKSIWAVKSINPYIYIC